MTKISATTIKSIQYISTRTKEEVITKICDHLLESQNDLENAMNILIEDSNFYKPFYSADLGELLVALSKDVVTKIQYKRPKRLIKNNGKIRNRRIRIRLNKRPKN